MANKKFSEFVLKTNTSGVSHIVGYSGAENVQITPANFVTTGGTGVFLPLAGGTMTGALVVDSTATVNDILTAGLGLALTGGTVGSGKLVLASSNKVHLSGGSAGLVLQNTGGTKSLTIDNTLSTFVGLVSGITPVDAANFVTKAYLDGGGGAGNGFLPLAGGTMLGNTLHNDNVKSVYGNPGNDLQIYHNGGNSYIQTSTGSSGDLYIESQGSGHELVLQATDDILIRPQGGNNGIKALGQGAVELYYNNVKKFETTSGGINVIGNIDVNGTGEMLRLVDSSATGNPKMSFYQSGNERAYIEYKDTGEKLIIDSDSDLVLNTNNIPSLTINSSNNSTFSGDVTISKSSTSQLQLIDTTNNVSLLLGADSSNTFIRNSSGNMLFQTNGGTTALTLTGANGTFAGTVDCNTQLSVSYSDISTGENRGLRIINTSGTDQQWNITAGITGAENESFCIRDATANVNALTMAISSGNATFAGNVQSNAWFKGSQGTNTLFSANSTGVLLQTSGNNAANDDSKIRFRNSTGAVSHIFDANNGDGTFTGNVTGVRATFSGAAASGDFLSRVDNTSGSTATSWGLLVKGGGGSSAGRIFQAQNSSGVSKVLIAGNGEVAIADELKIGAATVSSNGLTIEKSGNHMFLRAIGAATGKYWNFDINTNNALSIVDNGNTGVIINDGDTSWSANSDISIKENIKPLNNVLDKIKDYRCVEYNLKSDENKGKKIGFIAQDWEQDFDAIVSKDDDGLLSMKYTETIPVLLKAIQELKAEIELLKK